MLPVANSEEYESGGRRPHPGRDRFRITNTAGSGARNHAPAPRYPCNSAYDMEMDDEIVHLTAGDVLVQRGTVHNWVNNGTEPCVIAFVLTAAHPVTRKGKTLEAMG